MSDFAERYEHATREAVREARAFIEQSAGLYTREDMPAFIAGYLVAQLKKEKQ